MKNRSVQSFLQRAKVELNHIYTERPFVRPEGRDEGWFCREHAMHTYFLLLLFGEKGCRIENGHFAVRFPGNVRITSHGTDSDHAWCATETWAPIDLSMTLKYHAGFPNFWPPIVGEKGVKPYRVGYFSDEGEFVEELERGEEPMLLFLRQSAFDNADELLDDPGKFLFLSDPGSWLELYGSEAFAAITLHAFKVGMARGKSLKRKSPQAAFEQIRMKYSDGRERVRRLLGEN